LNVNMINSARSSKPL